MSICFTDKDGQNYERLFTGVSVGQVIKGNMRFPLPVESFTFHIKAINKKGEAKQP